MKEEKSFFKLMQKVPGGLIIVPMLIGVLANTFIPNVLEIGGFTSGMFKTGTACLLGMFLLLNGASIDVKKIGMPLYKGCTLTLMKIRCRYYSWTFGCQDRWSCRILWNHFHGNDCRYHKLSRRIVFRTSSAVW